VQAREFIIVREREIDVAALEIRPSVPGASEDAIERLVDAIVFVRPQFQLDVGIHPWVHGRGQEARAVRLEPAVHLPDMFLEHGVQPVQRGRGPVGLQLDDVAGQLVGPRQRSHLDLGFGRAGGALEEEIGNRAHGKRLRIDDHVLQLDPDPLEECEARATHVGCRPRASSRSRKHRMISR
jgi:hypothetical protein